MNDLRAGAKQTAYQILASSSLEKLAANNADLWDSGEIASDQSLFVPYAGRPLGSLQDGFWKVRLRDGDGQWTDWSAPATWRMGLLQPTDWDGAKWIGLDKDTRTGPLTMRMFHAEKRGREKSTNAPQSTPRGVQASPLLRQEIEIQQPVRRATAYVCGLGYFELSVNGRRIGDQVLEPGQTSYERRAFYVPLDITAQLKPGKNALAVMLGNAFYGQDFALSTAGLFYGEPRVKAVVKVEYLDGSKQSFVTGPDWKATTGPILFDNIYIGETYDARREIAGWNLAGFNAASWPAAKVVAGPTEHLVSQNIPPIRKVRSIQPVAVLPGKNGSWIIDLGQNIGGWLQIRVREKAGTQIRMRFAELLTPSRDEIDTASTGVHVTHADQQDIYVCRGKGVEEWEPRFTSHGFRYVEIAGLSAKPELKDFTGWLLRSDIPFIGTFAASDPRLEKFNRVSLWTLEDNLQSVLSDCPHRERCGWLGDLHAVSEYAAYTFDMRDFFSRTMDDIRTTLGVAPVVGKSSLPPGKDRRAPGMISVGKRLCGSASPDWGMALVLVPWFSYLHYGDLTLVQENWDTMTGWMDYLNQFGLKDGIIVDGLGDWCPPGSNAKMNTTPKLTSTALYYQALRDMDYLAARLGKAEESGRYHQRAEAVKAGFWRHFAKPDGGFGSQTATAIALWSGLVPQEQTEAAVASLENDIMVKNAGHYTTGVFGHRPLYTVLNDHGRGAVSSHLWSLNDWPSLGFLTEKHDLTVWPEVPLDWPAGKPYTPNSFNHPMHSGFAATFYESLAGIRPDPAQPGFKNTIFQPTFLEGLESAAATLESPYGAIRSAWKRQADKIVWTVTVPANTTAQARLLPGFKGMPADESSGVKFLREEEGRRIYALESGTHGFILNQ